MLSATIFKSIFDFRIFIPNRYICLFVNICKARPLPTSNLQFINPESLLQQSTNIESFYFLHYFGDLKLIKFSNKLHTWRKSMLCCFHSKVTLFCSQEIFIYFYMCYLYQVNEGLWTLQCNYICCRIQDLTKCDLIIENSIFQQIILI